MTWRLSWHKNTNLYPNKSTGGIFHRLLGELQGIEKKSSKVDDRSNGLSGKRSIPDTGVQETCWMVAPYGETAVLWSTRCAIQNQLDKLTWTMSESGQYQDMSRTSVVSSSNFRSILIFASFVVGTWSTTPFIGWIFSLNGRGYIVLLKNNTYEVYTSV